MSWNWLSIVFRAPRILASGLLAVPPGLSVPQDNNDPFCGNPDNVVAIGSGMFSRGCCNFPSVTRDGSWPFFPRDVREYPGRNTRIESIA